jgi:hypothetical protein
LPAPQFLAIIPNALRTIAGAPARARVAAVIEAAEVMAPFLPIRPDEGADGDLHAPDVQDALALGDTLEAPWADESLDFAGRHRPPARC